MAPEFLASYLVNLAVYGAAFVAALLACVTGALLLDGAFRRDPDDRVDDWWKA